MDVIKYNKMSGQSIECGRMWSAPAEHTALYSHSAIAKTEPTDAALQMESEWLEPLNLRKSERQKREWGYHRGLSTCHACAPQGAIPPKWVAKMSKRDICGF